MNNFIGILLICCCINFSIQLELFNGIEDDVAHSKDFFAGFIYIFKELKKCLEKN